VVRTYRHGDITHTDYADESYDAIACLSVVERDVANSQTRRVTGYLDRLLADSVGGREPTFLRLAHARVLPRKRF
jgi:hypothetical protein